MLLGGDGVVKRGKREDFGQNGGNSWDLYRPSRDQRQERIPGGSTPRSAGRTCTHTHTRWLARSRTHAHTHPYTHPPTSTSTSWAGGPRWSWQSPPWYCAACLVLSVWPGFWSGLVPGPAGDGVPLLFLMLPLLLEPGECAQAEQRSPTSKQQPGPLKVESHAVANQGR